ncbi:MAG: vitamin K epoxide reductase family protein, partial [Planctomycetota bacterium]
ADSLHPPYDSSMSSDTDTPRNSTAPLWVIRVAALTGLVISGYLFVLAAKGVAPPGCGEGAGCAEVLASRWAKVWRFPVSAPAMVAYLVVLAASLHAGPRSPQTQRDKAWRILKIAAIAAGGSALWFIYLQLFVLREVCPFCMGAHLCSLIIAFAALLHGPRALPLVGLAGAGALIATQVLLPPPAVTVNPQVRFTLPDPALNPTLGDPAAPHTIALLYDYNCYHCLVTHEHLRAALDRYPGQLNLILLPTAIDPACNTFVSQQSYGSRTSCDIARLALAVWVADAEQLDAFDAYLVEQVPRKKVDGSVPPEIVETLFRAEAERRVGAEALAAALADPRIDAQLEAAAKVYGLAVDPTTLREGVPRIIIGEFAFPGFEQDTDLFKLLEATYPDLKPTGENR